MRGQRSAPTIGTGMGRAGLGGCAVGAGCWICSLDTVFPLPMMLAPRRTDSSFVAIHLTCHLPLATGCNVGRDRTPPPYRATTLPLQPIGARPHPSRLRTVTEERRDW